MSIFINQKNDIRIDKNDNLCALKSKLGIPVTKHAMAQAADEKRGNWI